MARFSDGCDTFFCNFYLLKEKYVDLLTIINKLFIRNKLFI